METVQNPFGELPFFAQRLILTEGKTFISHFFLLLSLYFDSVVVSKGVTKSESREPKLVLDCHLQAFPVVQANSTGYEGKRVKRRKEKGKYTCSLPEDHLSAKYTISIVFCLQKL